MMKIHALRAIFFFCSISVYAASVVTVERGEMITPNMEALGVNAGVQRFSDDRDYWDIVRLCGPTMLRYPSGTPSSLWNWKENTLWSAEESVRLLKDNPVWMPWVMEIGVRLSNDPRKDEKYSAETYAEFAKYVGAEVSWILNVATDTPENIKQQIDALLAAEVPLRYVELGNELNGAAFVPLFPSYSDYRENIVDVVNHLQKVSPDTEIAIPTDLSTTQTSRDANNLAGNKGRHHDWAERSAHEPLPVNLVQHNYLGPTADGDIAREIFLAEPDELREFYVQSPYPLLQDWKKNHQALGAGDKEIWLTEYNLWTLAPDVKRFKDSMVYALYFANWWMLLLADDVVTVAHYHSLEGELFGLFTIETGWMGREGLGYEPGTEDFSDVTFYPQAELLSQISASARMASNVHRITFKGQQPRDGIAYWRGRATPSFNGLIFEGDEETHMIILNLTPEVQPVAIEGLMNAESAFSISNPNGADVPVRLKHDPKKLSFPMTFPIEPEPYELPVRGLHLPPFSFSKIIWKEAMK
ncbi:hypothetical protein [Rubellicoccus peritrichatus]|uniref:Alpha-L-arabinofuranosidase n=1 Tax=Rubellicoccus peritrichatus TaxID=3080537 RepID=A0AAQ3LEV0_9BACT|nr:hypothetical protein [Puniceicoccus sp. CR14]WOO43432.1 hypothetical protein RZN69_10055 [Puniceicoccus sp. CR14]